MSSKSIHVAANGKISFFLFFNGWVVFIVYMYTHIFFWRRKWPPAPIFLHGKAHGQRSLAGHSLWGCRELDTTERLNSNNTDVLFNRPFVDGHSDYFDTLAIVNNAWVYKAAGRLLCLLDTRPEVGFLDDMVVLLLTFSGTSIFFSIRDATILHFHWEYIGLQFLCILLSTCSFLGLSLFGGVGIAISMDVRYFIYHFFHFLFD